ncbi:CUE domain-containing protein 2 [Bicyclus anynana]|uniref:CUE domain-containing protein 2 n=1 Tax=Bicyclus anynana TaxID=110368 RepID=A0A6J1NNT5_BICAN|nr:CUE domain-containing protein 2 [Bicyclus anynana]XP_023946697.1 CUE domain-containing protein 2 [Bicyclus anynana]
MSAIAQQECHVKESLFQFINKNIPSADVSVIDDIVLSYVISILEEASQDPCFDLDGFIEMMSAYIPKFATIDSTLVCSWVLELEAELSRRDVSDTMSNHDESAENDKITLTLQSLNEMLPSVTKNNRSHSNSENSECSETTERRSLIDGEEYSEQCKALNEMFPNTCAMEIKHCVSIACGDAERAAATLLHRREQGQALSAAALHAAAKQPTCDDQELKSRIIARYSYVDKNSQAKEHRPLAPKIEPKKLVRYRDNKIVSLKGERYTEVPKSGIDEEHLKKPKKQHCP